MKVGRHDYCPCGSGKKYKKCCINKQSSMNNSFIPPEVKLHFERMQAIRAQVEKQQGLGHPIISCVHKGYRFISCRSKLFHNKAEKWQTCHDFLIDYIKN